MFYGAKTCKKCFDRSGSNNGNWSGGTTKHERGYVYVRIDGKYRAEHWVVVEELIGRQLLPGENVHHINGVTCDNRPENLELWVKAQPSGIRAIDALDWAREIVRRYEKKEDLLRHAPNSRPK